ncbi:MAG: hypothetical protein HUU22_05320 [Phycisphaerae bacterium]|nr:hypothetical protein [Phycisphaerae bacterium]NUQ45433.1 hypothetical protein [Phycisphaerae bacterium]
MTRIGVLAACLSFAGCAGPGPRLFPVAPLAERALQNGGALRLYDVNGDGRADFGEQLSREGLVESLHYDTDADGGGGTIVHLAEIASDQRRDLVLILDSIPYRMVHDLWQAGRFRYCRPPTRVISPFPVMTDVSLAEFFGVSPCPGLESRYYDGSRLTSGYWKYAGDVDMPWVPRVDYRMWTIAHTRAYLDPHPWFDHELRVIQDRMTQRVQQAANGDAAAQRAFIGYCVGPSSLGANEGRNGHQAGLIRVDRVCQQMLYDTRGRVRVSMFSDHGHNLVRSRRIPLADLLSRFGYRVSTRLERPGDIVVPEFGIVTYAAIHTQQPAGVARDVVGIDGVTLAAWLDEQDRVVVRSRDGLAAITKSGDAYCYRCEYGDPLGLLPLLDELRKHGAGDAAGCAADETWFTVTADHIYPDPLHRLWRAFHGLVVHQPDVLVCSAEGYHFGSALMDRMVALAAAHGSLSAVSSTGFAMTAAGDLPRVVQMENLRDALLELGVGVE